MIIIIHHFQGSSWSSMLRDLWRKADSTWSFWNSSTGWFGIVVTMIVMNYWKLRGPSGSVWQDPKYEGDRFQQQISRLAWLVFVAIALTPAPITPIIKGGFPQNTFRGQVCLIQEKIEKNQWEEDFKKGFLERFPQVVEIIYTWRFVRQVNRFVDGQCPGGKMCSIGKYRRNILGLQMTYWAALCGASFPLLDYFVRFLSRTLGKWQAFYVNFIILDSIVYFFYVSIFVVAQMQYIPSIEETPRRTVFYVSKPQKLEPRRWYNVNVDASNPIADQNKQIHCSSSSCNQASQAMPAPKVIEIMQVKEKPPLQQSSHGKENTDEIVFKKIADCTEMDTSERKQKVPSRFVYLSKKLFAHWSCFEQ